MNPNPEQYMAALASGNSKRVAAASVRREVAAGTLSLADALEDPRSRVLQIGRLLSSQRGWGDVKIRRALRTIDALPWKHVESLTDRQRKLLVQIVNMNARRAA